MPVSSSTEHWIKPDALTINLNHFGDPDYLQVSVLAGAVVMAFKQDVIGYNAAHNYRTWPLEAANTYLETSSAYNVYARLTRSEVNARALIVYDTVLRDIEGREITYAEDGAEILGDASADYFFVFLGQVSSNIDSNGQIIQREWIVDPNFGNLDTNQQKNDTVGLFDLMFKPHYDNPLDPNEITWIEALTHLGVAGGVTMYTNGGKLNIPSIYDGLPIDRKTLIRDENGVLMVNPEIELGGGVSNFWDLSGIPSWITNTKPIYDYSEIKGTPDLSVYALTSDLAKYVTLAGDETIAGLKNFTKGLQIDGLGITKSQDDVIYLDANLVVRGGITMYAEGEVDIPSIIDSLPIASTTSKGIASFDGTYFAVDSNGKVTLLAANVGLNEEELAAYLTEKKYATQSWVHSLGYASSSDLNALQTKVNDFLEGSDTDTIINKWKELEFFLSGLSESDNLATILGAKANQSDLDDTNEIVATKWTQDDTKINNWDNAYKWGNHADVGYALKSYVDNEFKKYVTLADDQTISGVKTFTNGLKIGTSTINQSQNDVVYIDANLVVRGGITMYSDNTVDVGTIFDALPIDGNTIYWDKGVLKANITEGVITNITSDMVVEALGFTPYNASNPKGYISGITSAMVVSALGYTPLQNHQTIYALTIQKNGTNIGTYTPNSAKKTINIVVPTKVSELDNDEEYATTSDLDSRIDALINGAPTAFDTLKEIADVLQGNVNSIGDIITTLGTKADKAIKISAGTGLSGGGTLEADRTLSLATSGVTAGTYTSVTVDKYGRVTSGTNPTTLEGYGITDAYTKSDVNTLLGDYVTLATAQTITGEKNFTGVLKVNGSPIVYDATNKYWKLEGDLLVTGGVTMYASDSAFTPSTIMDAIATDGTNLKVVNGVLTFVGSIDGGEAGSVAWDNVEGKPSWITDTKPSYSYSEISGTPTLLSSFTNDVGFITSFTDTKNTAGATNTSSKIFLIGAKAQNANPQTYSHDTAYVGTDGCLYSGGVKVLTAHQTIYNLTMQAGAFSAVTFDPNGAAKTVNIPTTTSHISEGDNLYYTNARAQAAITGGASTIATSNLTKSRALVSNSSGKVAVSAVTSTELGYLDGVTSAIQTQLNAKLDSASYTAADVLTKLKTVDGSDSGLDADLLDGTHKSDLLTDASSSSDTNLSITVGGTTKNITDLYAYKATQLETARKIWGQSFNGTKNISGALSGATTGSFSSNVTIGGTLGVTGDTTLEKKLTLNGIPIYKSQDGVLYIDGNLAVKGGITMYATDAIDVPSIIDALPIASTSAKGIASFNPSDFVVIDGVVSYVGKSGVDESVLADYAKKTDLSAYLPLSGGQMTGDIGYSIGKGSYDVGIPASGTIEAGLIFEAKDFTNLKSFIGTYHNSSNWMNIISVRHRNGYNDGAGYGMYIISNLTSRSADLVWNRQFNPNEWQGDRVILDSVNWSQYVTAADGGNYLPTSGGIINGNNNGWVLEVQSARAKTYLSHGGGYGFAVESTNTDDSTYMMYCGNGLGKTVFKVSNLGNTIVGGALYVSPESSYGLVEVGLKSGKYAYLDNSTPTGRGVSIVAMNAGACVGGLGVHGNGQPCYIDAAYTASPLLYGKCDVNIDTSDWGISFSSNNVAKCWLTHGGGYGMYIGVNNSDGNKYLLSLNSGQSVLGSGGNIAMIVYNNGNMLVGGGITMYSDIRKKTKLQDVELSLKQIADAPLIEHYYNSDAMRTTHVGSIAQYWAETIGNDWFCKLDNEGFYTMEIQNAALASAISIARELVKYESKTDRKIRLLKQRVKELEDKIEKLENN